MNLPRIAMIPYDHPKLKALALELLGYPPDLACRVVVCDAGRDARAIAVGLDPAPVQIVVPPVDQMTAQVREVAP